MPKNLISPVVKARSNEVSPAVVVVIYLDIDANDEPDSGCSGKRSTQQIGGEAAVGCRRHENLFNIQEPKLDFSSMLGYFTKIVRSKVEKGEFGRGRDTVLN